MLLLLLALVVQKAFYELNLGEIAGFHPEGYRDFTEVINGHGVKESFGEARRGERLAGLGEFGGFAGDAGVFCPCEFFKEFVNDDSLLHFQW